MADNQREIERLQRQISEANREIRNLERDFNDRMRSETAKLRKEMKSFSADMKNDYIQRLQEMEQSFSNAYLNEIEQMRKRYNELTEQVTEYEKELDKVMERLETEQACLVKKNEAKNKQYEDAANKAVQKLQQSIQDPGGCFLSTCHAAVYRGWGRNRKITAKQTLRPCSTKGRMHSQCCETLGG